MTTLGVVLTTIYVTLAVVLLAFLAVDIYADHCRRKLRKQREEESR